MSSPADSPGARRLEQLDERAIRTATELQAIADEQLPDQLKTNGQQFSHEQWVEAELEATMDERERMLETVTPLGEVLYEQE